MTENLEVLEQLSNLFDEGNLEEFRTLLEAHPEHLRGPDGADIWLWQAAMEGKLDFIQLLVDMGLDVNASHSKDPEGCIANAASEGQLEVVQWLLDHGAQINFVVDGTPRCIPLTYAATLGHLDVVKLLVERGADVHATWNGVNAVTQADMYGRVDVREYLRSLGAKDIRETTPRDFPRMHKNILDTMIELRGPLGPWREEIASDPVVTAYLIPANPKHDGHTLFTVGLSDRFLVNKYSRFKATELRLTLPVNWPAPPAGLDDPQSNWPVTWLKRMVNELLEAATLPGPPALFPHGDPPAPLAENTNLCGWLGVESWDIPDLPNENIASVHDLIPLYPEELALIQSADEGFVHYFMDRFPGNDIPLDINPQRANLAGDEEEE